VSRLTLHFSCFSPFFCNSLFVYKYKQPGNGPLEELDIQAVLPIYGEFSIVMSQMRRETSVLLPTSSTSLDQQSAGW
jgi:phosphatidylinositol-bisphosphatase